MARGGTVFLGLTLALVPCGRTVARAEATTTAAAPLRWIQPAGFDPAKPGLGLPALAGVTHEVIYAPRRSSAPPEAGGSGRYESVLHGTYNHHPRVLRIGDRIIVYWTNHSHDENGPGQRILARWGELDATSSRIDWAKPARNTFELAPAPVLVHRRAPLDAPGVDRRHAKVTLAVVDGRLRVEGTFMLNDGWTDDLRFRFRENQPVPDERFRAAPDSDERNRYGRVFRYDMFWTVGPSFHQVWTFEGGDAVPASPLYLGASAPTSLAFTPTRSRLLPALLPPYADAPLLASAPAADRVVFAAAVTTLRETRPHYATGTEPLAADGKNGLAHRAEFRRPDGAWVILRDNLIRPGRYYAATARSGQPYPPAVVTDLFGDVMPAAGELPDGRVWIIGNNRARTDFFLTVSSDGVTFDRTWSLLHLNRRWAEGYAKPGRGGPQYPTALLLGDALWIFYSIGKEQIGATRIPVSSLST